MQALLVELAQMSCLRDRGQIDLALLKTITKSQHWRAGAVRLMAAVGTLDDQRWLARCRKESNGAVAERDHVWANWSRLPKLSDYPIREEAIVTESVVRAGVGPYVTVFPIETQQAICSILEIESDEPLTVANVSVIESILWIYHNLRQLLDHGERDTLTELLNRKSFDSAFQRAAVIPHSEIALDGPDRRKGLEPAAYWLAVIDVDHFKQVNDNFGHLIGDEMLLLLAGLMRLNFRFHDQIYRFGSEEFVVLMRCADQTEAGAVLQRFRKAVEDCYFPTVAKLTVSIGYCSLRIDDTPGSAFDRADKAVYCAKGKGRNQVCNYSDLVLSGDLTEPIPKDSDVDFFF